MPDQYAKSGRLRVRPKPPTRPYDSGQHGSADEIAEEVRYGRPGARTRWPSMAAERASQARAARTGQEQTLPDPTQSRSWHHRVLLWTIAAILLAAAGITLRLLTKS